LRQHISNNSTSKYVFFQRNSFRTEPSNLSYPLNDSWLCFSYRPDLAPKASTTVLAVAELRARAACAQWTPEQLAHLEAESVKSKGEIPFEEQYSWLNQKLGWRVKYQDIKVWRHLTRLWIVHSELTIVLGLVCRQCRRARDSKSPKCRERRRRFRPQ
jgi:hypothetical protein